jgi:hypothetical protein
MFVFYSGYVNFLGGFNMLNKNRVHYSTTLDKEILKAFKILAVEKDEDVNTLIEQAMRLFFEQQQICQKSAKL